MASVTSTPAVTPGKNGLVTYNDPARAFKEAYASYQGPRQTTSGISIGSIANQFINRSLALPDFERMKRLFGEVEKGRTLDDIGAGLDRYLASLSAGGDTAGGDTASFEADLGKLTEDQIKAAQAEIEARYGLTRAELEAEQGAAGRAFRMLQANLDRQRTEQLRSVTSNALQRGIFRSGIYGENVAEVERSHAEQLAFGEADKQARLAAIKNALSQLRAQAEAEKSAVASQYRMDELLHAASMYGT